MDGRGGVDTGKEGFDIVQGRIGNVEGGDGGGLLEIAIDEGGHHGLGHFASAEEGDFGEDVGAGGGCGEGGGFDGVAGETTGC